MRKRKGIYIHIPFCVKKCNYCAFLSFEANPELRKTYVDALIREIKLRSDQANDRSIDTVYFGGGTPSVLEVSEIRDIMRALRANYDIKEDAEITIEANPGTLGSRENLISNKFRAYRIIGFNRLSMGVQSMDNDRLKFLGRVHTAETVEKDVRIAREAGFDNISLDLIFSVPGETKVDALRDLDVILRMEPEHISCYSLQIEEGTPLADMVDAGDLEEVPDEEDRETYHAICKRLRDAGYEHYEISNFARPGMRSQHNSLYWDMSDYIGFGLGASGFEYGLRYKNISDIESYMITTNDGRLPVAESSRNTPFDNISEAVFTGLRRIEGIKYEEAARAYLRGGDEDVSSDPERLFWRVFADAKKEAVEFSRTGHLVIDEEGLRLTEKGIDISNQIMALFV